MFCVCLMLLFVTSSEFFTVRTLFFISATCFSLTCVNLDESLCLVLPALLHKFLLLLHNNHFTLCCVFLGTPLCFARFVSFLACDAACRCSATCLKTTCSNWMTSWASFADGLRLLQSFWYPPLLQLVLCFLCFLQFVPFCHQLQLQTELPSELATNFSISTFISCFRSSASLASIDLASSAICNCLLHLLLLKCHTLPHIVRFVLLLLEESLVQLGSFLFLIFNLFFNLNLVFSCLLGNFHFLLCCNVLMTFSILISRHWSNFFLRDIVLLVRFSLLLAMLLTALCWLCSFGSFDFSLLLGMFFSPTVGYAHDWLLLAVLFCVLTRLCLFVQLSELLLVVVQTLRICAPFRQTGVASFVDFFSPLALLAVVLSLSSVFWHRLLQHYIVVAYCSEVRLKHSQRPYSVCATS